MPTFTLRGVEYEYATEAETLAFCNAAREAGGADPLLALLPGRPSSVKSCLLARSLNFDCCVCPSQPHGDTWEMVFGCDVSRRDVEAVAYAVECEFMHDGDYESAIVLPPRIANVARAFDNREGWTAAYVR